jgi:hypothetical protein
MNDLKEIRERGLRFFSNSLVVSLDESRTKDGGSARAALGAVCNSNSKHSVQIPFALTGVVHLLYFFPQDLQMAIVRYA